MITNVRYFWNWLFIDFDMNTDFFAEQVDSLPKLTPLQLKKLKHLTIVSLAAKNRVSYMYTLLWNRNEFIYLVLFWFSIQSIPYSTLQEELDIRDLRELEDLIIEAIYAGIIQAKLDQKNAKVSLVNSGITSLWFYADLVTAGGRVLHW